MLSIPTHPLITAERAYQWQLVRDCVAGEYRMKAAGEKYLPRKSKQSPVDYEKYKARAKWADYTEQALDVMHGEIFRRAPDIECPESPELKAIIENFDRMGHSLYQFASTNIRDNMITTFGGLLEDMPAIDTVITVYEARQKGIRPYVRYYAAENIKYWRYKDVDGTKKLSLVILQESLEASGEGIFEYDAKTQYRVLELDDDGYYRVQLIKEYLDESDGKNKLMFDGDPRYVTINGNRLQYIPFQFLPYEEPEKPVLYGTAELNKHYYMQSANYENGVLFTTIPTGYTTGHESPEETIPNSKEKRKLPIYLGGDTFLEFPNSDTKVGTLTFSGEGLDHAEKAIKETLEQIGILSTRAVSPDGSMGETADAARIHRAGENAKLATYARNISEAFTTALRIMADWIGVSGHVSVQFNVDYDSLPFDPNALNAIANLSREGKYPLPYVYEALKKGEYMPASSTLKEFIQLIALEESDVNIIDEFNIYQDMREGKDFVMPESTTLPPSEPTEGEENVDLEDRR